MTTRPKLTVMICTLEERIARVAPMLLEPRADVCYIISWQTTAPDDSCEQALAPLKERGDVAVTIYGGSTLSGNRNNAIRAWHTDYGLIADDDETLTNEGLDNVIKAFDENNDADLICFRVVDANRKPHRVYTSHAFDYDKRPRGTYFNSFEIAMRRSRFLPLFDERFGLNSSYLACGEEEVFVHQAYLNQLTVRFVPLTIAIVPFGGTGSKFSTDPKVRRSKGAVLRIIYGKYGAMARIIKQAFVPPSKNSFRNLRDMLQGLKYIEATEPQHHLGAKTHT